MLRIRRAPAVYWGSSFTRRLVVIRIEIRLSADSLGMDSMLSAGNKVVAIESLGTSKGVL